MPLIISRPHAQALTQQTFQAFLKERPKVILHIGRGSSPGSFLQGVIDHFSADLGDGIAFGTFDPSTLLFAPWLMKFVGTLWPSASASSPAPDGYYLFVDGLPRAFHPGTVDVDPDGALAMLGVAALVSLLFESAQPLGAAAKALNDTHAKGVIAFFEKILARPASREVPLDWTTFFAGIKPKTEDPYATLGITPSATRDEVRKAHKEKSASVHPDKVATLAPEFQKFAHDLSVRVNAAYAEINAKRGWA
jgi:hypothetical protein